MGGCGLVKIRQENLMKLSNTCVFSVSSKNKSILKYSQSGAVEILTIKCIEALPHQGAYTYSFPYVYIVGGSYNLDSFCNDVISINTEQKTLEYLPTLPLCCKRGEAYLHNDYLYYIGGVQLLNSVISPAPFLRLPKDSAVWEILGDTIRPTKSITQSLLGPGSCKVDNLIYIIGGEVFKSPTEKCLNNLVYTFDLDTLTINLIEYEGVEVISPRCVNINDGILVLGGYNQHLPNYSMWIIGTKKIKLGDLKFKITKPLHKLPGCFAVIGRNRIKRLREDKMTWKFENINKIPLTPSFRSL
jgi:hypothetical protein